MELDYSYHLVECKTCGRKILVEAFLFGVDHTASLGATCAACLKLPVDKDFAKDHPDAAKSITKWIEAKQ